ncbi:MAG: hypothetical protein ACTSV5_07525 [Promethearchaeota archaeon]
MEIIVFKRSSFSIAALLFGVAFLVVSIIEFVHMPLEEPLFFLFFSPGDAIWESSFLDHLAKALINLLIAVIFLFGVPQIKKGTLSGFGFLIGAGILALRIGTLFIIEWIANLIDFALQGLVDIGVWEDFIFTEGIRIEIFLGIGSIYITLLWKNRDYYLE